MAENVPTPKAKPGCVTRVVRWSIIAIGILIGCRIIALFAPIRQDAATPQTVAEAQITKTAIPTDTSMPTFTPLPTVQPTIAPSDTPLSPTETPAPTITPLPTETPLPTNTPVPPTSTPVPTVTSEPTVAWYTGGTLHQATWAEWKEATAENKMATAADWITNAYKPQWETIDELRYLSEQLIVCVDEVAETSIQMWGSDSTVTDMVVTCIMLMME